MSDNSKAIHNVRAAMLKSYTDRASPDSEENAQSFVDNEISYMDIGQIINWDFDLRHGNKICYSATLGDFCLCMEGEVCE